jgi:replication factor C subunit 3/5
MSDFEDEMDVDAPPVKDSIMFSSDNTNAKGKRSAANLPVEAEDSLPWYKIPTSARNLTRNE